MGLAHQKQKSLAVLAISLLYISNTMARNFHLFVKIRVLGSVYQRQILVLMWITIVILWETLRLQMKPRELYKQDAFLA